MFFESIKLENIRSYTNEEIKFSNGALLLAGDIGSGKSTVLLAIEFALFGLKKGELSGSSLLRNGKSSGTVELKFNIENKCIIIKRSLKRVKDSVNQDSGYIITNGRKEDLTPVEMRTKMFAILGYPMALVSKNKDLIYRYTIYTPQEEMKNIILEKKEIRLDTLRRVFNIDKYKRIKDNMNIVTKIANNKILIYETRISDLDEKKKNKKSKEQEINSISEKIKQIEPELENAKKEVVKAKERISTIESKITGLGILKQNFSVNETKIGMKTEQIQKNLKEIDLIKANAEKIREETKSYNEKIMQEIKEKLKSFEEKEIVERKNVSDAGKKIGEFETIKINSLEIKKDVTKHEVCPLCKQNVTKEHKKKIETEESIKIESCDKGIKFQTEKEIEAENKLKEIAKQMKILREDESKILVLKERISRIKDFSEKEKILSESNENMKKEIEELSKLNMNIKEKISSFGDLEKEFKALKQETDKKIEAEYSLSKKIIPLQKEKDMLLKQLGDIDKEIEEKEKFNLKLEKAKQMKNWINEAFLKLMDIIEKHIMINLNEEFNRFFQNWFNVLIEDETVNVRIDDEFTPVIEQNGYEIEVENLSGGEKTACALAYRLALNRVINDLISEIKTKDMIILDEPTDGFSSEQLDRVKNVIDELDMNQIIIVSHEPKIESFVDSIIKIYKLNHVSHVAYA